MNEKLEQILLDISSSLIQGVKNNSEKINKLIDIQLTVINKVTELTNSVNTRLKTFSSEINAALSNLAMTSMSFNERIVNIEATIQQLMINGKPLHDSS